MFTIIIKPENSKYPTTGERLIPLCISFKLFRLFSFRKNELIGRQQPRGEGWGDGKNARERGYMYVHIADSLCYTVETNIML